MSSPTVRAAFVCVRNAGRSQMATAFAARERRERGLEGAVEILTGGTRPADDVHDVVVEAMAEAGFDLTDRTPRAVTTSELESCAYVATMGCSTLELELDADRSAIDVRDWALDDPDGKTLDEVREIRADVRRRVRDLFEEIERRVTHRV